MKSYPITTKLIYFTATALLTGTLLVGCVSVGKTMPKTTANFAPKQVYAVAYDKLWDTTISALDTNRIAVLSASKESGIIQTDYMDGKSTLIMGGLAGAQSTRYKYNLTLRNQSAGNVKLNILCKVESTINSGRGSSQWSDVSGQNTKLVKQLEDWLYEQIEKDL
jgi:hypothetical protein